jgi:hypothetical protein
MLYVEEVGWKEERVSGGGRHRKERLRACPLEGETVR